MSLMNCFVRVNAPLLLGVVLLGCPEIEPEDNTNSSPMNATEICALYNAWQAGGSLCVQAKVFTSDQYDAETLAWECRAGTDGYIWAQDLLAAESAGRVKMDWKLAHSCVDKSRALRKSNSGYELFANADWKALEEGACKNFYAGITADGQHCTMDWDCAEGSGCYSDTPWEAGSQKCMKPGVADALCNDTYHPCATGFFCASSGPLTSCIVQSAPGGSCDEALEGADCTSASCTGGVCDAAPLPAPGLGDPCQEGDECADDCSACLLDSAGGTRTCMRLGETGRYCEDWLGCLDDLGCTNNVCTGVGANEPCGGATEALCAEGLSCIPEHNCSTFNQADCGTHAPTCTWDSQNGVCSSSQGLCVASLPSSGACLFGWVCDNAAGSYCNTQGTCVAMAERGASCSEDGIAAPFCRGYNMCHEGTCKAYCENNSDCSGDTYCGDDGLCIARPAQCSDIAQCADKNWCNIAEGAETGTCEAQLEVGAACVDADQCLSGDCATDANGTDRCAVKLSGCYNTALDLRQAFLLGGVIFGLRGLSRLRRRKDA